MSRITARLIGGLLVPLAALTLASCSGGTAGGSQSDGADESVVDGYVSITDQQGSVEGFVGASEDVEVGICKMQGDSWTAAGEVANPTDDAQSYRLYVAFQKGRDTKGLVQVDVASVGPGETAQWTAEAPVKGDDLECMVRVERFEP